MILVVQFSKSQIIGTFEHWDSTYQHPYRDELIQVHKIQDPNGGIPNKWHPSYGFGITRTTDSYVGDYSIILHNWYHFNGEQI